jgi:hypothetical protein
MGATFGGLHVEQIMYMYITGHTAIFSDLGHPVPKCILALIMKRLMELNLCIWCMISTVYSIINLLKPTGHVMHQQFNIQQLYVLPTLYLCVLYLSENKQRLVPLTA